jgi:carbon monoxide dehydrogenase subunit G
VLGQYEEALGLNIASKVVLNGTPEQVWDLLMDPTVLAECLPGCEKLEVQGPDSYVAHLSLGVAAIKGKYQGRIETTEKQPHSHYKLLIQGEGTPGWVKAQMAIDLAAQGDATELAYNVDAQVGGLVASVGSRMLTGVAKMMLTDMFKQVGKQLELRKSQS